MVATLQYKIEGFKFIKKDKHRTLTNGHWQKAPEFAEEKITKLMNTGCPGDDVVLCLSTMVAFKWMFTHLVEARMRRGICLQRSLGLIIGKFLILQVHAIWRVTLSEKVINLMLDAVLDSGKTNPEVGIVFQPLVQLVINVQLEMKRKQKTIIAKFFNYASGARVMPSMRFRCGDKVMKTFVPRVKRQLIARQVATEATWRRWDFTNRLRLAWDWLGSILHC